MRGYLKIKEMKNGYTYVIQARNAEIGVWNESDNSFLISRFKFGSNFIDKEYHWDIGSPHGTAKPIIELEKAPEDDLLTDNLLIYLNKLERG